MEPGASTPEPQIQVQHWGKRDRESLDWNDPSEDPKSNLKYLARENLKGGASGADVVEWNFPGQRAERPWTPGSARAGYRTGDTTSWIRTGFPHREQGYDIS